MKDIDYMCCYYNSISIKHDDISQCQSKSNFTAVVGITVIPFIIRVIMVILLIFMSLLIKLYSILNYHMKPSHGIV